MRDMEPEKVRRRRRSTTSRVTMADVAAHAGVSAQTVSRVLRQPELVGEEVARRVRQAIADLQYVPNFAASQMASNRSGLVAAIIPTISASVFAQTIQGLSDVLLPHGYQLILGNTDYDIGREEELLRSLLGRGPDGIVLSSTRHSPAAVDLLTQSNIPVVETWDWEEEHIDLLVGYSNRQAAFEMVRHLHARGYRRIAFAGVTNDGDFRAIARLEGYRAAAEALGIGSVTVRTLVGMPLSMEMGAKTLVELLEEFPKTDAVFFSSDIFAAGAILECQRRGIRVPDDLAIAGFGDFEIAANIVPSLTTVAVPAAEIGKRAGLLLLERMQDMQKKPQAQKRIDVGFRVIAREST